METMTLENVTLERAVEVVRALRPEQQQQLRRLMDTWQPMPVETTPEQERQIAEHLLAKGLIVSLPARYREGYNLEEAADQHPPIVVQGLPVSETLLEDREPR